MKSLEGAARNGVWVVYVTSGERYGVARARLIDEWVPWRSAEEQAWRLPEKIHDARVVQVMASFDDADRELVRLKRAGRFMAEFLPE